MGSIAKTIAEYRARARWAGIGAPKSSWAREKSRPNHAGLHAFWIRCDIGLFNHEMLRD